MMLRNAEARWSRQMSRVSNAGSSFEDCRTWLGEWVLIDDQIAQYIDKIIKVQKGYKGKWVHVGATGSMPVIRCNKHLCLESGPRVQRCNAVPRGPKICTEWYDIAFIVQVPHSGNRRAWVWLYDASISCHHITEYHAMSFFYRSHRFICFPREVRTACFKGGLDGLRSVRRLWGILEAFSTGQPGIEAFGAVLDRNHQNFTKPAVSGMLDVPKRPFGSFRTFHRLMAQFALKPFRIATILYIANR